MCGGSCSLSNSLAASCALAATWLVPCFCLRQLWPQLARLLMLMLHFVDATAVPHTYPLYPSSSLTYAFALEYAMRHKIAISTKIDEKRQHRLTHAATEGSEGGGEGGERKTGRERDRSARRERDELSHHIQHELPANHVIN